jgi:hypothetical protein
MGSDQWDLVYEGDASWLLMRLRAEQDAKPGLRQARIGFNG